MPGDQDNLLDLCTPNTFHSNKDRCKTAKPSNSIARTIEESPFGQEFKNRVPTDKRIKSGLLHKP
jgi:hypothetical protein